MRSFPTCIQVAVDTEFFGSHTLTIQTATRLDEFTLAVQLYRSPAIPDLPMGFDLSRYVPLDDRHYGRFVERVELRPTKLITADLSPAAIISNVLDQPLAAIYPRCDGAKLMQQFDQDHKPPNVELDTRLGRWSIPAIEVEIAGHFLPADFFRMSGSAFYPSLLAPIGREESEVVVRATKVVKFTTGTAFGGTPLLQYIGAEDGALFALRLTTFDTCVAFGNANLDRLSQTFLGMPKSDALTAEDKGNMLRTFHDKTEQCYGYAIVDAVNTLLIREQMESQHHRVYQVMGLSMVAIPPCRPTLGSRVAELLVKATCHAVADSKELSSERKIRGLMRRGGRKHLTSRKGSSMFGEQTVNVHGGLLYSRSPTRFWHEAKDMLRDIDIAACYSQIVSSLDVYHGRPVIFEPGSRAMSLKNAIAFAAKHAEPDGWVVRATGNITRSPNALVASTIGAVTSANYRGTARKQGDAAGSRLYSRRVESGIVTWATWLMIEAMPDGVRQEYEMLNVDTILLYPSFLVANTGREFDELVERHRSADLPWAASIDLAGMRISRTESLDADYVALRFAIGDCAKRIAEFRRQAQVEHGKGSGADATWKLTANTMYGALTSVYFDSCNVVAGNQITAQARATAFAISQSLNAIQTITDGCTYRLDQVPACTFRECLRLQPDYPIRRADDSGIRFLDPTTIPTDNDEAFTNWYREHVRRFFEVSDPKYEKLFDLHKLEHKKTGSTNSVVFDALACDGAGNYIKCSQDDEGNFGVEDAAMRAYGRESKEVLADWLVRTYSTDRLTKLPPVTEDRVLLKFDEAMRSARKAIRQNIAEVVFPLGFQHRKVGNYRIIKPSMFVFQTPEQRNTIVKQIEKFEQKTGCGLEVLVLRRSYGGRRQGSLEDLVREIYAFIQEGGRDLTKRANLTRGFAELEDISTHRKRELAARKDDAERTLMTTMNASWLPPEARLTGWICSPPILTPAVLTAMQARTKRRSEQPEERSVDVHPQGIV
jgi:hypothetical protein